METNAPSLGLQNIVPKQAVLGWEFKCGQTLLWHGDTHKTLQYHWALELLN